MDSVFSVPFGVQEYMSQICERDEGVGAGSAQAR